MKQRRFSMITLGLLLLIHPIPMLFHTVAVGLFALLAGWPALAWSTLGLVVAAHMAMQLSIAVLNDYCDRHLDAVAKPGKPIPRGLIHPGEALVLGLLLIIVMLLLLLPLPPLALLVSLLYLALGMAYNLRLKATPWSGVVFALAMPLIPLYAFVAMGRELPMFFWLLPVAALLGVALNLSNSLPDLEEDARQNARTLAVALGVRRSFLICPLLILLSMVLIAVQGALYQLPDRAWILLPALAVAGVAVIAMFAFFGPRKPRQTRKLYFYLVVMICLVLAAGWLSGVIT
ncbi:MAG: UbiA family prenyltransferase [Ktedonobacteraceae bacterium]|nr:UbiA family prenyltransferase [Ktedonobacteraceae bacterium]